MPRVRKLVECVGAALCEYATAALARLVPFETALLEVARSVHRRVTATMTVSDLRACLRELVSSSPETVELGLHDGVADIRPPVPEEFRETLVAYLELLPEVARQALRRPGDPEGTSVPEGFEVRRPEDWLLFLPDRLPLFRPGDLPPGLDNWRTENLRGLGPYAEVWDGYDDDQPELSPACLKFITDPAAREAMGERLDHIKQVLDLEPYGGLIPLRSAYLGSDPPCLEYVHLPGYDLANLMHNARWKGDRPRPDQAGLIVRRVARIVGQLHRRNPPIVHRGLKPSNILLSPTETGGISAWVSDVGWGQITAALPMTGLDVSQAIRRSLRGSYGPLYASRQQRTGGPADPRDDVYAIGVLWYQLLMRDPTAKPVGGVSWATNFRRYGLSDGQAALLASCISKAPADRPADGIVLADLIAANSGPTRNGDSATIRLRGSSAHEAVKLRPKDEDDARQSPVNPDDEDEDQ
jgi:hypothetical protein